MTLTLADQMLYSTVKLSTFAGGKPTGSGTGFFYTVDVGDGVIIPLIITNKHVVKGADQVMAMMHRAEGPTFDRPSGAIVQCIFNIGPAGAPGHPDSDVDLCCLPMAEIVEGANRAGTPLFYVTLGRSNIPEAVDWENFDSIEEVVMIGCPRGIYDEANNLPIVRRGTTATPLNRLYNGRPRFVVDMACFPGSSGSPVFVYNPTGYLDRKAQVFKMGSSRFFLVGILFAGPMVTNQGQIVLAQPPRIEVASMMHLGYVIPSTELFAIEQLTKAQLGGPHAATGA